MADNRNPLLRQAFEEAARKEIKELPTENLIIRPYSKEHDKKMNQILNGNQPQKKKISFRRTVAAVLAAVLTVTILSIGTSALLSNESMLKLFNTTPDPENYENIDIKFEGAVTKEDDFDVLTYTGEPVKIKYTVDTGESWEWPDKGLMIFIDGVRQTFDAKVDDEEYKAIDMLHLKNEQGTVKSIEFTLEPNIGKKGDVMYLDIMAIFDPELNYYPQCNNESKQLFVAHWDDNNDEICDKCSVNIGEIPSGPSSFTRHNEAVIKLVMEKDAPAQTAIADNFSGTKVSKLNEKIYSSYNYEDSFENELNDYDTMEGLAVAVYKDVNDSFYSEYGAEYHATRIETDAKVNDEFIVNLHGGTGKYRVSVYINNDVQNVFDGAAYADVNIVHGQQTELTINLDTTKLPKGDNYCYVLLQRLDGEEDTHHWLDCFTLDYTIEIK